ncbi:sugar ABC transporter permease [Thioclava sp. SK-1]|uniref:ABC transporter permease n=1 Tax=Thioclava sp. SK-1 TaxID=1889770 RepID=UPI0008266E3E|nr:ABC transporter permease [Thioclava sp. SK-1]OCX64665.1 sugar ABC transporter permease [Thioclava sp. SK-1]
MNKLPKWADLGLVPLINVALAFGISMLVILAIGGDPVEAIKVMVEGAVGSSYAWGYTLYFTTSFLFTGLSVTVAYHASQFNIGSEGQAQLGGLGVALVCLAVPWPHWALALPAAMIGAALFGLLWALIPAWLQAKRGSHIVITTIMFNYIASALLVYLLGGVLKPEGSSDPATARFGPGAHLPALNEVPGLGMLFANNTPVNISFFVAVLACVAVWFLLFRSRLGYEIRAYGKSESAAIYAGISPTKVIVIAMLISGGLAGMMAINNVMGESERLVLNSAEGAGFIGIAVALMGRNHPFGVFIAALLFGMLYQGGGELGLWTSIPIELRIVLQGLVILFTGALNGMSERAVIWVFAKLSAKQGAQA